MELVTPPPKAGLLGWGGKIGLSHLSSQWEMQTMAYKLISGTSNICCPSRWRYSLRPPGLWVWYLHQEYMHVLQLLV